MTNRSSDVVRKELHAALVADLRGPAEGTLEGSEEEVVDSSVRTRYLVGQLAPKGSVLQPEEQDEITRDGLRLSDDGEPDEEGLASRSLVPSSVGLTFAVAADTDELRVTARWGSYEKTASDGIHLTETGQNRKVWKRRPSGGSFEVDLRAPEFPYVPDPGYPQVVVQGKVRRAENDDWIVTLFLVNGQAELDELKDRAWLFQPLIRVESPTDRAIFRKRPLDEEAGELLGGAERRAMEMLYRRRVEFAFGHGIGVHAEIDPASPHHAKVVETRVIPFFDVAMTEPPSADDEGFEGLADLVLDMKDLAELPLEDLTAALDVLADEYEKWIERQKARIGEGDLVDHQIAAERALEKASRTLGRLREGMRVLSDDAGALEAFRFANRAMWHQRVRSEYVRRVRRDQKVDISDVDIPRNRSWRPFQLAFVLITLPSLADPEHPERTDPGSSIADLLWFPTGGGKTEAYLGVAACAMALRRLQDGTFEQESARGVAVIMRYTLRLLTIQQFQRATALLCAMEFVRRRAAAGGDDRWGDEPFRIGLWVGNRATPGRTSDAAEAIKKAKGDTWNTGIGTPAQLTSCPWCGEEIRPGRDIDVRSFKGNVGRTLIFCPDEYGECPFSRAQAPNEGLPVLVVDSEIYQRLPSLIIATVDKFAQMPWKGEVQTLFGRVNGYCERHGFINPEIEKSSSDQVRCTGNHHSKGRMPSTSRQQAGPLRPPDLIIQDELHLISGPLGTVVGQYETAIDELCAWPLNGKSVHPKVIASTATIRRAQDQVHELFLRRVEVFPPHGVDAEDNFFSVERSLDEVPGRRYLGICAPGKSRPAVLIRVYVALLTAAQHLFEKYGDAADPYMTLVGYFNSLRELGGMRRLVEDDVSTRAFRMGQPGQDLDRPGLAQRTRVSPEELTSRRSSTDIPRILDRLEVEFDPSESKQRAIDVLLATNMVSVGVDVQRLGLMVVAGQPKTTAEYIQATSRVGRRHPGIVCTVLNWARPRDMSHYETFEHYHSTFYQHVEALSLTPFAPRAIDRALAGVLASLVRLDAFDFDPNDAAAEVTGSHPVVQRAIEKIVQRSHDVTQDADIRELVRDELNELVHEWAHRAREAGISLGYKAKKDGQTVGLLQPPGPGEWGDFTVLTSMRDVEPSSGLILSPHSPSSNAEWEALGDGATE